MNWIFIQKYTMYLCVNSVSICMFYEHIFDTFILDILELH